ncbi:hypothetical protein Patl1_27945 [Pistacia atlantica]|uniref:Uncharacterized protein n=1 Tax=Pistacia atlantica TaxID=434234 RepID=A0ACC1BD70_9ROSI|nr:hypothetical protein Patl1_27945 [Pistacia atlantica]
MAEAAVEFAIKTLGSLLVQEMQQQQPKKKEKAMNVLKHG